MTLTYLEFLVYHPKLQERSPIMQNGNISILQHQVTRPFLQCSARAAQDIEGHHRPVLAFTFRTCVADCPSHTTMPREVRRLRSQDLAR